MDGRMDATADPHSSPLIPCTRFITYRPKGALVRLLLDLHTVFTSFHLFKRHDLKGRITNCFDCRTLFISLNSEGPIAEYLIRNKKRVLRFGIHPMRSSECLAIKASAPLIQCDPNVTLPQSILAHISVQDG